METLRTTIRFLIILIAIGILIFLSVNLFKLIPKAINQIASITMSVGDKKDTTAIATTTAITTATATPVQVTPQAVPVTSDGLNGVYRPKGDIVIAEKPKYTSVKEPVYTPSTHTYYSTAPVLSGRKNLKITYLTMGVIENGRFVARNTFNTNDTISVRFNISNTEDTETGPWSMRVEMPTTENQNKVKILTNLTSIPGESSYSVEARFSGLDVSVGTPSVRLFVDTNNQISETNENDNTIAIEIKQVFQNYYNTYPNCTYYNNYNCNTYTYNYNTGYLPNLSILSLETGRLINGTFYTQNTVNYGERVAIRARVRNNGASFTNAWVNKISLVDGNGYTREFPLGTEYGLASGAETSVTYELDYLTRGSNRITFTADSQNNINESNEGDNTSQSYAQVN